MLVLTARVLDDVLLDEAAALGGADLRSLNAIHGLAEVITYDLRMTDATGHVGVRVIAPA